MNPTTTPRLKNVLPYSVCRSDEQIERADRCHHEGRSHARTDHVVRVLPQRPRVEQRPRKSWSVWIWPSGAGGESDRMLHPRIGGDDEIPRQPGAGTSPRRPRPSGQKRPQLFSPSRNSPRKLDSRMNAYSPSMARNWPITRTGHFRESRPVGAELKLHRNSSHHTHGEIDGEDLGPEARRAIEMFVLGDRAPCFSESRSAARAPWSTVGIDSETSR